MVVVQRAEGQSAPEPGLPSAQISSSTSPATPPEPVRIVDPHAVARRVYDLLRQDLVVDRIRRVRRS
jgi:hypothetical protein